MSTEEGRNGEHQHDQEEDELEGEDIVLSIDDEGDIWIETAECKLVLAPEEARNLGQALLEMADEAESEEPDSGEGA